MSKVKKKASRKSVKPENNEDVQCCSNYAECPIDAQKYLKEKCFKMDGNLFIGGFLDNQKKQLDTVVRQGVESGESNSVLVIGPRGSGKSKLVSTVLLEIQNNHKGNYYYVYLSGLIHTDDRAALQDMARQLELENVVGDRVFGSFSDNLAFILDALKNDDGQSKSVVLVLDEFDLFAYHKNQSLLYNLFDIAQSKQNPICVIGITCRLDVVELLEKRVKSRYSHRAILTFPTYLFDQYLEIARDLLTLSDGFRCKTYYKRWQKHVKELLDDDVVVDVLKKQFNIQKDVGSLVRFLTPSIYKLSSEHRFILSTDLLESYATLHADSKTFLLNGLSILELSLLVAAKHVNDRREGQPFNYEMVYNEYQHFLKRRLTGMQNYTKAVAFKAYEHLWSLELFKCTETISQNSASKEYKPMTLLINPTQIIEIIQRYPDCPTELRTWVDSAFA